MKKCQKLIITSSLIDGVKIERVGKDFETKSLKFVGVNLDEFLNWEYHINNVKNKLSSAIYALNQVKNYISSNTMKTIYNSLFQPHLEYSIITWGISRHKDIESLRLKQKKLLELYPNQNSMPIVILYSQG